MKNLTISLIIPAYNEERYLAACLDAVATQTIKPYEVIVVDNNSSDATIEITSRYSFVTLLNEPLQGVTHARSRGFDAASGDIIARIDADTLLPADWIENLQMIFEQDPTIDALSGSVDYYDLPYKNLISKIDLFFRQRIANGMGHEVFLYGANMAMRHATWQKIAKHLCHENGLHEDFDMAIHAHEVGAKVVFDARLKAAVSLRRVDANWRDFLEYALISPRTYAFHGKTSQRHMYPALILVISFFWLIKLIHRGYDAESMSYSLHKLLASSDVARPNPATFVD